VAIQGFVSFSSCQLNYSGANCIVGFLAGHLIAAVGVLAAFMNSPKFLFRIPVPNGDIKVGFGYLDRSESRSPWPAATFMIQKCS